MRCKLCLLHDSSTASNSYTWQFRGIRPWPCQAVCTSPVTGRGSSSRHVKGGADSYGRPVQPCCRKHHSGGGGGRHGARGPAAAAAAAHPGRQQLSDCSGLQQPNCLINVSSMDLVHAAVAAIRRSNDTSFTLGFTGTPGKLASIQLKPNSYTSTAYLPGRASGTLAVQVPTLGDVMPAYTVAAHVLLPMSTAAAGVACLLSVLVAPGSTLPGCLPAILRSFGHMQLLAASASMTHTGLSGSYADAAQQLNWALLQNSQWLPGTAATQAADAYTRGVAARFAVAPPPDSGTWAAAEADGSVLDAWLAEMQRSSSALIASYDVSTGSTKSQLLQLPLASRAVQPQLPGLVVVRQDVKGPAVQAWNGLFWSAGVAAGMLALAMMLHVLAWVLGGRCRQQRRPWRGLVQPPPVQMPQLLLVVLLLALPAVVHWAGCLAGTGQTLWMVLTAMLSSCCTALVVYSALAVHIVGTAEDAMLGPDQPETPATSLAGNAQGRLGQPTSSSLAGFFSASGGAQSEPIQRIQWAGQPVAEGVVQTAACSAGSLDDAHSEWSPCATFLQDIASAAAVAAAGDSAVKAYTELTAAGAAAGSSSCGKQVADTLLQHEARVQQHRQQGAHLSSTLKPSGMRELQQQLQLQQLPQQEALAGSAASPAAAAVLATSPRPLQQQQQQQQHQQHQQQSGGPIGEADEADGGSSSGGGRQYVYSSNDAGQHVGNSSVTSVSGFFEDVTEVDIEELQRQQIMQVRHGGMWCRVPWYVHLHRWAMTVEFQRYIGWLVWHCA
ncbi:hypothetical protein COO60DRAFT_330219 [Scenedesmus sp. NREL 46B-D3]|nr:hypothetical protein COO60DRAFT_330219 [Scenedesmus sp. NREL 46B-D3]